MSLPAGTLIRMADGTQRPIEDVRLTDQVVMADGSIGTVIGANVRQVSEVKRLRIRGHAIFHGTPNQLVLASNGFTPLAELDRRYPVVMPKYLATGESWIATDRFIPLRQRAKRENRVRVSQIPGKPQANHVIHCAPDVIHLTHDFGRLCGLFLAEGNTDKTKSVWTFSAKEWETIAQEVVDVFQRAFDSTAHKRLLGDRKTTKVTLYGYQWARVLEGLLASGAGNKSINATLLAGPIEFQEAMLTGWLDGDGAWRYKEGREGTTISKKLALNMFDIANVLGLRPYVRFIDPRLSHGVKSRRRTYKMGFGNKDVETTCFRAEQDDKSMRRPLWSINDSPVSGWVYDLKVDGDGSYVADAIAVKC